MIDLKSTKQYCTGYYRKLLHQLTSAVSTPTTIHIVNIVIIMIINTVSSIV